MEIINLKDFTMEVKKILFFLEVRNIYNFNYNIF